MRKLIASIFAIVSFAFSITSCTNYVDCTCSYSIANEVVDSALWNAAGQPIYLKSEPAMPQTKAYLRDTVSATGNCSSLNYYDQVGVAHPSQGLVIHSVVECWEK